MAFPNRPSGSNKEYSPWVYFAVIAGLSLVGWLIWTIGVLMSGANE
jgi:hypothetical protein